MAVINLESLVLCGVAVPSNGKTVNLRHETSDVAMVRTPVVGISKRHPQPGYARDYTPPTKRLDDRTERPMAQAVFGAGRSRRQAGVLSRSSLGNGSRAIPSEWSPIHGGAASPAAACWCFTAQHTAFAGKTASEHVRAVHARSIPVSGILAKRLASCLATVAALSAST